MAIESRIIERDNTQYVVTVEANKLDNYIDTINEEFDFLIDSIRTSLVESQVNNIKIKQYIESVNESTVLTEEEKDEATNNKLKSAILSAGKFVKAAANKLWQLIQSGINAITSVLKKIQGKTLDNVPVKRKTLDTWEVIDDCIRNIAAVATAKEYSSKSINDYMIDKTISNNKLFAECNKSVDLLNRFKNTLKTSVEKRISMIMKEVESNGQIDQSDLTKVNGLKKVLVENTTLMKSAITYLVQTINKLK